jgi:hypothetical protein
MNTMVSHKRTILLCFDLVCRGINFYTLHLQDPGQKAASKQATSSSSTLLAAAPQQQAAAAAAATSSSSTSAANGGAADAACPSGSQLNQVAPVDTTSAEADRATDAQQLHTIMEQSTIPRWQQQQQQQQQQLALIQGQPLTGDSGMSEHSQRPRSPRHKSNMSDLSESDLALFESPFAINLSGQFSDHLAGAGLISESEVALNLHAAETAAAAATGDAGDASKSKWKRARSMPASAAATAAAAAGAAAKVDAEEQQQQRLRQRASCSVLQRRLTTRASAVPGYKMKPLQVKRQWGVLHLKAFTVLYSTLLYKSWLGRAQLAMREPWALGHELLLHPSF